MRDNSLKTLSRLYPVLTEDYERVITFMTDKRVRHTLGVFESSVHLQSTFGGNLLSIARAALYHDLFKGMNHTALFELGESVGYSTEDEMRKYPEIAHGPIAALWLEQNEIVTESVTLNAIRYHTVGRAKMTIEEKIVYLADAIEAGRDYPGIDQLRLVSETSLDDALLISVTHTLSYVLAKNRLIHPQSIEMRNELLQVLSK